MAISINKCSKEIKEKIVEDYLNNKSLRQIEQDYDVSRATVSKYLEKHGIKNQKGNHYRKYFHDFNYFEVIDSEEKAYWLGFMFADGYIVDFSNTYGEDSFGISISKKDYSLLEKFKKSIQATNPIKEYNRKGPGENLIRLLMTSQKTVNDLINHGCVKQKSLILKPPSGIPNDLIRHFIRGFFDGDGCITKSYLSKIKKYIYSVQITSTLEMVSWIKEKTMMGSIVKEKRRDKTYYYELGGNIQLIKFYHYLYDDSTIYLDRKYEKFKELLNKYSEN